jgi:peptidoglycan L-alanyl-D-glutamate endopeptidase CwlK
MPSFSVKSRTNLNQAHPDLQVLFNDVIQFVDCSIICGYRNERDQNEAYDKGFSKLRFPQSRHNKLPSEAVDAVPYPIDWNDIKRFQNFGKFVINRANKLFKEGKINNKIVWGGNWKTFKDYPHFEIYKS